MGDISAIELLLERRPELKKRRRGLPGTGARQDNQTFYEELKVIDDAFTYSNSLYSIEELIDKKLTLYNAGGGSPLRTKPFPPASEALRMMADAEQLSQYQLAAGDVECREALAAFLRAQHFCCNDFGGEVSSDNVIFTDSTTEAFYILLKLIVRPYDVVLFTGPTYGLFAYMPERANAITRFLPLKHEDNWLVNPNDLREKINEINTELCYLAEEKCLSYIPRVAAFININPSNPTGRVMGKEHLPLLCSIVEICSEAGTFVIDDIIYRELCFDSENQAVPLATLGRLGGNIITLMGLSKAYGLAGARVGMIVASEVVTRGVRDHIFQQMDSTPLYVGQLMRAAYELSPARERAYTDYFCALNEQYIHKWKLMQVLVEGTAAVSDKENEYAVKLVRSMYGDDGSDILVPIPEIKIAGRIIPESGFFVLLDLTGAKGKRCDNVVIRNERDVLYFYYRYAYVKLLMGKSMAWPIETEFVARVNFAMADEDIVRMIKQMKDAARKLHFPEVAGDE